MFAIIEAFFCNNPFYLLIYIFFYTFLYLYYVICDIDKKIAFSMMLVLQRLWLH